MTTATAQVAASAGNSADTWGLEGSVRQQATTERGTVSVKHQKRVEGVVDDALKSAAAGEAYGFVVSPPAWWPFLNEKGEPVGAGPAWCVTVTIRNSGIGEPDLSIGWPIPGFLPKDEDFRMVAKSLIAQLREVRDQKQGSELDQARARFQKQMEASK